MNENIVAPFRGIIEWIEEPKEGTTRAGKQWKSVNFTIKYVGQQMKERYMTFILFGIEKVDEFLQLPVGTEVVVTWEPSANLYRKKDGSGKAWFPQNTAFSVTATGPQAPAQAPYEGPAPGSTGIEDMPF